MNNKIHKVTVLSYLLIGISLGLLKAQINFEEFDWDGYKSWENTTAYTRTYVVNQKHPDASDENPGSQEKPLLTINKAAQLVEAGERVLVYSGVYREMIQPKNEGTGPDNMISYETVPGEKVIIKGSRVLHTKWEQRRVLTDVLPDTSLTYTWSRKIWVTTLPDEIFEEGYYPFKLPNILPEEYHMMPWAKLVKNLSPYNSTRGMLFQNGKRMIQLEDYGDLSRLPGAFWVDTDGKTIHIHPYGSKNPQLDLFEVGVQHHLLIPQKVGLGYIQVRGFTFEHCANGFLRTKTGAVNAKGGHHWIFEDNTIRNINSSGLEFGFMAFEGNDPDSENIKRDRENNPGGMIVRNNTIHDCGTAGIRSFIVKNAIIENNTIYNCGWQDAENYWECGGIKILLAQKTIVKGNHIYNITGGNGIWLDWDNQYSRVTRNIIHDVQSIQGGVFVEASQTPNLVDNNIIWNIDGNGIYGNDTDYLMIFHNLIANTTGSVVNATVATKRKLNGRWLTATNNKVYNNIFINGGKPINFSSMDNKADYNYYISTCEPSYIHTKVLQESGFDKNSIFTKAHVDFFPEINYFIWQSTEDIPVVPYLKESKFDWYNQSRSKIQTVPGPFSTLSSETKLLLNE